MMRAMALLLCMVTCAIPAQAQEAGSPVTAMDKMLDVPATPGAAPMADTAPLTEDAVPKVVKLPQQTADSVPDTSQLGSLFFTQLERDAIDQAKKQYRNQGMAAETEADLLDQLQDIKAAAQKPQEDLREKYYAQFYLQTLLYHQPNDWSVWIKDNDVIRKLDPTSAASPSASIRVTAITPESVTFEWKPRNWMYVSNTYKPDTNNITLDRDRQMVIFTLRVNQTLLSYDMQVKEGYVELKPLLTDGTLAPLPSTGAPAALVPLEPERPNTLPPPARAAMPNPAPAKKPANSGGILGLYKTLETPGNAP